MTMYMTWRKKEINRTFYQIPVLTTEEKLALKARIADALGLTGVNSTIVELNV